MSDLKTIKISPVSTKKEDAVKEFEDFIHKLHEHHCKIGLLTGTNEDKKYLAIREWITMNMDTISDETNIYSIDDLIERLNSVCKLEAALDNACEELEELSKEVGNWKTKEEWKKELLK